jgi:signal transduction histidine kinase
MLRADGDNRPVPSHPGWRARVETLRAALWTRWPDLVDWGVAAVLTVLAEGQLALVSRWGDEGAMRAGLLLTTLQTVPLGLRRRHPFGILLLTGVGALVQQQLGLPSSDFGTFGVLVAFYTVVAEGSRRLAISIAAVAAAGIFVSNYFDHFTSTRADGLFLVYVQFLAAWVLGSNARLRRQHIADLQDRARRIERERKLLADRALSDERARIGRELHDVISHSLGVVLVHAGAARAVVESAPDSARGSLASIETIGRQALTELRRVLHLVRDGDEPDGETRPGLASLPGLVSQFESAGLTVDLEVTGEARPLPPTADLSAYRILQEALTNTLTHAGPVPVRVTIGYHAGAIVLEVADGGAVPGLPRSSRTADGHGHGLVGMRERARLFGGEVWAGPDGRGFTVRARLPLEGAEP